MNHTESCLHTLLQNASVKNIAVKVGRYDEVLYERYLSTNQSIDAHTMFDMASVTKIIATTSLALLALDQERISLEDPISKFFCCPPDKKALTLKHLLTHTCGIGHKNLTANGNTYENIADHILGIPSDIPIGSNVLYSCPGFILLGKILEIVFDMRLNDAFRKYVAAPLDMTDTAFLPNGNYQFVNSNLTDADIGKVNDYNCRFLGGVCGNAGLFSNMNDLTKYVQLLLYQGAPLISEKTFVNAAQNHTKGMSEARGLGFLYVSEQYEQANKFFAPGSIGHCGHTGQSLFADPRNGLYAIILSDATISTVKRYGHENYQEVKQMRAQLHEAIATDLMHHT